jgi:hypothetical protein
MEYRSMSSTNQLYGSRLSQVSMTELLASQIGFVGLYRVAAQLRAAFDPAIIVEANYSGYARFPMGGMFGPAVTDAQGITTCKADRVTFRVSGPIGNAIWGLVYYDITGIHPLYAQDFPDGPRPMFSFSDYITFFPRFSVTSPIFP